MGGLSGHMTHVYEDYNLKMKDVKNIISGILNSQIQLKEKGCLLWKINYYGIIEVDTSI